MINQFYHVSSGAAVQFTCNPNRGNGDRAERFQTSGYDSNGFPYVYSKNKTKRYNQVLTYPHQSETVLSGLITFFQARNGDKSAFTWYDHDGISHTVRFAAGSLKYKQQYPGLYRMEISIGEDTP